MCLNFRILGPAVRGLLQRYGLSPSNILASGPRGLLKGDVLLHIQKENLKPVPSNYFNSVFSLLKISVISCLIL